MEFDDEIEEERRLMYVAVTRARERLYLTRANSRYMYGSREYMVQSRFLKEAQPVLSPEKQRYEEIKKKEYVSSYNSFRDDDSEYKSSFGYSSSYAKTMLNANKPKVATNNNVCGYKSGVKVKHAKFGEGTVIAVKGQGENIIVDVAFKGVGIKALSAKFAPMEIL